MITKAITALAATVLLLCACNHKSESDTQYNTLGSELKTITAATDSIPATKQVPLPDVKEEKKAPVSPAPKPVPIDWDKKIIKTADMNVEVKDFKTFSTQTKDIAKKYGSYVAGEKQQESEYKIENSLTLKVPVAMFDDMVYELSQLPVKIISKQIGSEDVTTEMVDTKSRIEAKKQVRDKYMEFLKGSKNMEEVLQVQSEINGVQEQIETAAGRVNYLGHAAAYSTIHLTYYQVLDAKAAVDATPGFSDKLGHAMGYGLDIIKALVLGVVTIWPLLLIAFIAWFLYKRSRKPSKQ
jgi:type IV secretory pathway VirB10-like protein